MEPFGDVILSGGKRISGNKYRPRDKSEVRHWTHKKHLKRMEMLSDDIKLLEDDDVRGYFISNGSSELKSNCRAYQTLRRMATEVIKPQPVLLEKARAMKKETKFRARRNERKEKERMIQS